MSLKNKRGLKKPYTRVGNGEALKIAQQSGKRFEKKTTYYKRY